MPIRVVNCPYCGSESFVTALKVAAVEEDTYSKLAGVRFDPPISFVTCMRCDLTFRSQIYSRQELKSLYAEPYRDHILNRKSPDEYAEEILSIPPLQSDLIAKINNLKILLGDTKIDRCFDVGCGVGVFLASLQKAMPSVTVGGLEPNRTFAATAARITGGEILTDEFNGINLTLWDLVTCLHVLEHTISPWEFLKDLNRSMRKNSFLYLETPSIKDIDVLPADHDRFMSPHLYLFSTAFIFNLLVEIGFRPISVEYAPTRRGKIDLRGFAMKT